MPAQGARGEARAYLARLLQLGVGVGTATAAGFLLGRTALPALFTADDKVRRPPGVGQTSPVFISYCTVRACRRVACADLEQKNAGLLDVPAHAGCVTPCVPAVRAAPCSSLQHEA